MGNLRNSRRLEAFQRSMRAVNDEFAIDAGKERRRESATPIQHTAQESPQDRPQSVALRMTDLAWWAFAFAALCLGLPALERILKGRGR